MTGVQEMEDPTTFAGDLIQTQNLNRLATLRITSPPSQTSQPESTSAQHCKTSGPTKRRSPSTPSSNDLGHRMHGYTILGLPTSITASNSCSPGGDSTPDKKVNIHVPTNCPASAKSSSTMNAILPPRPISRASTAPSSMFDALLRRKGFDGISDQDKMHTAKRLKRMKDRMKEMSQWCEHVLVEGEENIDEAPKSHASKNEKEEVPASVKSLSRASTAPPSTFDAVLRENGLVSASDRDSLDSSKRSKRMKDRGKEMSQCCSQVIHEVEEDGGCEENNNYAFKEHIFKNEPEEVSASAWVEKAGECVAIQFKCPCEKVYELLLSENHIYYKLIPFQQDGPETEAEEKICVERYENWLVVMTKCPCGKGYRIALSGKDCFYKLL